MEVLEKKATKVKNIVYLWDLKASRELLDGTVLAALENRPNVENLDHTDNQTGITSQLFLIFSCFFWCCSFVCANMLDLICLDFS